MTEIAHGFDGHVVVVGSGIAGLVTALRLAPQPVVLVTRATLGGEASSELAQGGMAASLGPDDSSDLHLADTLLAGDGLCDPVMAASVLNEAPLAIALLERFGVRFRRDETGAFSLGLEAAHARRRIAHSGGDGSGRMIVSSLARAVRGTPSITVLEHTEVRRLQVSGERIRGLLCIRDETPFVLATSRVMLATGGIGGLYEASTNPLGNYGQGIMLAARAGAVLADMEFVQFHPTALDTARRPLALVTEAVRGEGAILVNERRERFLAGVAGAELAPRDIVARAIASEIARGGKVFLDARMMGTRFAERFPTVDLLCREAGIDPSYEPIPVRPAVHYHMGGVATDGVGRSTVTGLWVVGEAASTGLHGANRLASNSLTEAVILAGRAADDISGTDAAAQSALTRPNIPPQAELSTVRPIVSRSLGVLRTGRSLEDAIAALLPEVERDGPAADPALIGMTMAVFASLRKESRGAHARSDFPSKLANPERRSMTLEAVLQAARSLAPSTSSRHMLEEHCA